MDLTTSLTKILTSILGDNFRPRDDEFISPHVTIWYLKRNQPAQRHVNLQFTIEQTGSPDVNWYRELYKDVGGPWMWWERIAMNDDTFNALFAKGDRLILTPVVDGKIAGFSELKFISKTVTEIVYFGLKPEFIGQGIAKPFMEEVVATALREEAKEVRLNTCSLDHPRARSFYKSLGYAEYDKAAGPVHIPKALLDESLLETRLS